MDPAEHELPDELSAQGTALRRLARSILRGADGADDIVQQALVRRLAARGRVERSAGWLPRVVQNLARRRLRDVARQRDGIARMPPAEPAPATDDVLAQVEQHRLVADAVMQLGEPYRTAVVMRYWHDLPPRAIAARLEVPVATVKTHLQRGLAELRRRLDRRDGGRAAWVTALSPIAYPKAFAGGSAAAAVAALPLVTATTIAAMKANVLIAAAAVCLCLGVISWQPWSPAPMPPERVADRDAATVVSGSLARSRPDPDAARTAPLAQTTPSIERTSAEPGQRTCTIVGRIVTAGGAPAFGGRLRLVDRSSSDQPTVAADRSGHFELAVPRPHDWLHYSHALADAPGWAVRERAFDQDLQESIRDDRLDLGTFELERGVAVRGRVVEADGAPLRTKARLLSWDPARRGGFTVMYGGRTAGFVDPGGTFTLPDRLSAGREGAWMLAAVCANGVGWARLEFAKGQQHLDPVEIRLLPGGGVDVRVVDQLGQPVADARVVATPHFRPIGLAPMWGDHGGGAPAWPEVEALFVRATDADGRVRFDNLPRRDHPSVRAANLDQPPGHAMLIQASREGYVHGVGRVNPVVGGAAELTITLQKTRRFRFSGTVMDGDGKPLRGVTVTLATSSSFTTRTDEHGRYDLPECAIGSRTAYFMLAGAQVPDTREVVELPESSGAVAHDFVVETRAPVTGRVVDQHGRPVAGVRLFLGVPKGIHYRSAPERTAADGAFAFPDAVASHTDLWIHPPEPLTAWRAEPNRSLSTRDGEVIVLHRLDVRLVDLALRITDARTGLPVSPTEVELEGLIGSSVDPAMPHAQVTLAHGLASAADLRPGRYRATVRAADGLQGEVAFDLAPDTGEVACPLWPPVAVDCTVDDSALSADQLARLRGRREMLVLEPNRERSFLVDDDGVPRNFTPNTGVIRFGGRMTFRLERVTANLPLRLRVLGNDVFGETWFTATPGRDAAVTVRLVPFGRVAFRWPESWTAGLAGGAVELSTHDGEAWRPLVDGVYTANSTPTLPSVPRPAGPLHWRMRVVPTDGGEALERSGTVTVPVGETVEVTIE